MPYKTEGGVKTTDHHIQSPTCEYCQFMPGVP
jgi:hypothetical protein